MTIRAVAFDLDGTLLDTTGLIVDSFLHVFESHGLTPLPREHWERGMGLPLVDALRPHARDDAHAELLVAAYRAYNLEHHDARVSAYPGVVELIAELRARGLPLAVVSNKLRATVDRGLEVTALAPAFTIVLGMDDVVRPKPDPEAVLRVAAELRVEPSELAMVGDSPFDIGAAKAAGALAVAATWGPGERETLVQAGADVVCATPAEVSEALLGHGGARPLAGSRA